MSRNHFYFFIFSLVPAITFFYNPIGLGDLSIWTALGVDSLNNFKIVTVDTYTVSETAGMVYPVLISIIYGLLYKISGIELVSVFHALVPSTWVYIWYLFLKKHSPSYRDSANYWDYRTVPVFFMALMGCALMYIARPALIATIPVLISYYLITLLREKPYSAKNIIVFVLIEIIWVNIHGSFLLLPMMILWTLPFLLIQKKFELALNRIYSVLPVLLSTLINPFTWQVFPYAWQTAVISKARKLDEWFPPYYFDYPFASWYFYLISVLVLVLIFQKFRSYVKFTELVTDPFFMFWLSGFFAIRNTFFIFLVLPVFVFDKIVIKPAKNSNLNHGYSKIFNLIIIILIAAICTLLSPFFKKNVSDYLPARQQFIFSRNYRVEKINAFLNTHVGSVFNTWEYGSDLALVQKNRFFIDTRNIIFSDAVNEQYELFLKNPDLNSAVLTQYRFKYFLIHKDHQKLINWLKTQSDFRLLIEEGPASLYEKTDIN